MVNGMRILLRTTVSLALLGALTGCGGASHPGAATPSPTAMTTAQLAAIGARWAQCLRDHGLTGFPDPTFHDGTMGFTVTGSGPDIKQLLASNPAAQAACHSIMDELPPGNRGNSGPSQQDLVHLRDFARCMRAHGIPEWPDPKPDGTFPLIGTPLAAEGKSARVLAGMQACKQYWSGGINGS
jgi:hypothetical protein